MSKNLLLALLLIGAAITAGVVFVFASSNKSSEQNNPIQNEEKTVSESPNNPQNSSQSYIHYEQGTIEENKDSKLLLFFYANWCPTCRPVNEEISSNTSQIPEDVKIIRVNYNDNETSEEERDLARKYNITYQHTFVYLDENRNEIDRWNGGGLDNILNKVR